MQKSIIILCVLLAIGSIGASQVQAQTNYPLQPYYLIYSPDGNKIAGTADRLLRVWDAETGTVLVDFPSMTSTYVENVTWSPDSQSIASASGDQFVRVWNVDDPGYLPGQLLGSVDISA